MPLEEPITIVCKVERAHTLSFDPGAAGGEKQSVTVRNGVTVTLTDCSYTAPENMVFDSWSVAVKGNAALAMNVGEQFTITDDTVVTAIYKWKPIFDINKDGAVNAKDVSYLRRALAGGYGISLNAEL